VQGRFLSSTILLSCYPVNYGFFSLPAQVDWHEVNFKFECGAPEKMCLALCFARVAEFAVGGVLDDFAPVEVALQDVVACCELELSSCSFPRPVSMCGPFFISSHQLLFPFLF
jgi:hypothetical protein